MQTRREAIAAAGVLAGCLATSAVARQRANPVALLEQEAGGRLGVFALDLETGQTLANRAGERFKLMSAFKALLTAMVLKEAAAGRLQLSEALHFGKQDLLSASPVTTANVMMGQMSIKALCEATMARSDNAAANLLMRRLGGPAAVTAFLRSIEDKMTRIDNYEGPLLGTKPLPADSTTPHQAVATLRHLLTSAVFAPSDRTLWQGWMASNVVGKTRLRAAFPLDWEAGDRTGTAEGICNDIAFARRPGRAPLLLAAFYEHPGKELRAQEEVLRGVSKIVVDWQR